MLRLFIRLYLLLVLVLLVAIVVDFFEEQWFESALPPGESSAHTTFTMVRYLLAGKPESQWSAEIDKLRESVHSLEPLQTMDALSKDNELSATNRYNLTHDKLAIWTDQSYCTHIAERMGKGPYALHIKLDDPVPRVLLLWVNMATLLFIMVGIAMWFWVRPIWRDLKSLDAASASLSAGNFDVRVNLKKRAMLYPLAQSFNWMAERVGALLASHRALTNAVSHELRTPLARLRFSHTLALDETDAAAKDRQLAKMGRDMHELDALASELLTLAKLERAMDGCENSSSFPAHEWLNDRIEEARETALALQREVTIDGVATVSELHGNPNYLARALDNLLSNAIRHAQGKITVRLDQQDDRVMMSIDDDGPGIPEADRIRVFEPFVRLDDSRDRMSGGVGLGLSIVRQIARMHGGDCSVEQSPMQGARFVFTWALPANV